MSNEHVRDWVKQKLEEGVSEARLRKTLKKSDYDTGIVDEVVKDSSSSDEDLFEDDGEDDDPFESLNYIDEDQSAGKEESEESYLSAVNLPQISLEDMTLPGSSRIYLLSLISLVLVLGIGYSYYTGFEPIVGQECEGGGTGVKMYSVTVENGGTVAEVFTAEEVEARLDIYRGGEKVGGSTEGVSGRQFISADVVGDRAVFHEDGCEEPSVSRNY